MHLHLHVPAWITLGGQWGRPGETQHETEENLTLPGVALGGVRSSWVLDPPPKRRGGLCKTRRHIHCPQPCKYLRCGIRSIWVTGQRRQPTPPQGLWHADLWSCWTLAQRRPPAYRGIWCCCMKKHQRYPMLLYQKHRPRYFRRGALQCDSKHLVPSRPHWATKHLNMHIPRSQQKPFRVQLLHVGWRREFREWKKYIVQIYIFISRWSVLKFLAMISSKMNFTLRNCNFFRVFYVKNWEQLQFQEMIFNLKIIPRK